MGTRVVAAGFLESLRAFGSIDLVPFVVPHLVAPWVPIVPTVVALVAISPDRIPSVFAIPAANVPLFFALIGFSILPIVATVGTRVVASLVPSSAAVVALVVVVPSTIYGTYSDLCYFREQTDSH